MAQTSERKVVVVGQGYVGLPLAMRAVEAGYDVVGYDVDPVRVARLNDRDSYVEDVSNDELTSAIATGRYVATTEPAHCESFDIAVVTVPTPLREGVPDVTYIEEAAQSLAKYLRPGATVILESTTYPGTTEGIFSTLLTNGSGLTAGSDFFVGFSPERIDPGNRVWGFANTPKLVSGIDPASLDAVLAFYDDLVETTVVVRSPREAELAKLLENTFRHVNIALVNELAMFAHDLGIDIWETIDAAATKPFGFMRFTPGPGVGGHCLPIDPSYLSWQVKRALGHAFRFVELANDVNDHMPDYLVRRVSLALNRRQRAVHGARILVLGLAYKKNTGDARESPAVRVAQLLLSLGADVRAADPHVVESHADSRITRVMLTREEVSAADHVVLLTDHDDFDLGLLEHAYVLDARGVLPRGEYVEHL
ncbi:MAG: nucleotide sugar dehydrogenase [Mycobacteriales bacterium]|nr:nucleotide sugar dehydrogenase [Frankia sp.]MCA1833586.1 nucleotide sugar dehydrogenase [Actinomycetota bacterium]